MSNSMATDMTQRFKTHLHTINQNDKAVKTVYYWVMSTLESFFWSYRFSPSINADLYAAENQMFLVIEDAFGDEQEYKFIPTYASHINIQMLLEKFIEIFNYIKYPTLVTSCGVSLKKPRSKEISFSSNNTKPSSSFLASYCGIWNNSHNRSKYNGFHRVSISVYMLTDENEDFANRGING